MLVLHVIPYNKKAHSNQMIFSKNLVSEIEEKGVLSDILLFDTSLGFDLLNNVWQLHRKMKKENFDIVHAHFGTVTAFACALVCPTSLVITYHGSDLNPSPHDGVFRNAVQKILSQLAALRANRIICVSQELKDRLWWRNHKVTIIPSSVDLEHFRPFSFVKAREHLNWNENERIVLFNASGSSAVKRLDLAEASVQVIKDLIGDIKFVVLKGNISHQDIPIYLNASDCLLITSDYEGSPTIVKEALACSLPIVSVDVGDVAERLEGVFPSQIVPRTAQAIGKAAAEIITSRIRSNGREKVFELSNDVLVNKVLDVYQQVLQEKKVKS